jgi:hypothetical protein
MLSDCSWDQSGSKVTKIREVSIGSDEVIVSANVTTDGDRKPCTISFSVLDFRSLGWRKE